MSLLTRGYIEMEEGIVSAPERAHVAERSSDLPVDLPPSRTPTPPLPPRPQPTVIFSYLQSTINFFRKLTDPVSCKLHLFLPRKRGHIQLGTNSQDVRRNSRSYWLYWRYFTFGWANHTFDWVKHTFCDVQPTQPHVTAVLNLDSCPAGYPRFAALIDSDDGFSIFRRFGYVQTRLILEKQDEMRQLEEEMMDMDKADLESDPRRLRSIRYAGNAHRQDFFKKLETKYHEYAQLLCAAQKVMAFNRPTSFNHQSLVNFVYNERPVPSEEEAWVHRKEDVVALMPPVTEPPWLEARIERFLHRIHCPIIEYIFSSTDSKRRSLDASIIFYNRERIEHLAACIIVAIMLIVLGGPMILLHKLNTDTDEGYTTGIGIVLLSTLLFSTVLSIVTKARRLEIVSASAAYCAVLVVFLGNAGPTSVH